MRWNSVRAGLIAIAIAFGLVDGCPIPPPHDTPAWERGFVEPIRAVRDVVEWPVAWIVPRLRVSQRWALYQDPGSERFLMVIEGQTYDRQWHVVFRPGDPDHDEDAEVLLFLRVRGAWDPTGTVSSQYARWAGWALARVLARHAELGAARVRMEKVRLVDGNVIGTGEYLDVISRTR